MRMFLDRYYEWSIQEALREVSLDFQSIRAVQGMTAAQSAEAMRQFVPTARRDLAVALVKRRHQRDLNAVEQELVARFKRYRDESRFTLEAEVKGKTLADRKKIRDLVRKKGGGSVLGEMQVDGTAFHFTLSMEGHRLITIVDTGGRARQLDYSHTVWLAGAAHPASEIPINLMAWLGLSSATKWDFIARGGEERAVDKLLEFGNRFITAMPSVVGIRRS